MQLKRAAVALLFVVLVATVLPVRPASAKAVADRYSGANFGVLPAGCEADSPILDQIRAKKVDPDNVCYHMRTGLNALDSPQIDVLVMVPVSPTAERDMRIMRQSVEMWEGGIEHLAPQMGLKWLADGVDFHITVDYFDPTGSEGGEFSTYPVVDPEIVVVATNPVGGIGIGIDPLWFLGNPNLLPCLPMGNPFDFKAWESLPGFSSHHGKRTGTYSEDCKGSGGNVCFAVNAAIDPVPGVVEITKGLFDLVSHEVGHCLTVGHVGDGAEGKWGAVPTNDIMAYSKDPPGRTKCVSTLDVEAFAARMSGYLDVNGDRKVDAGDQLSVSNPDGDNRSPFQTQHPDNHLYASTTGSPTACPQPDIGLLPGRRTNWQP